MSDRFSLDGSERPRPDGATDTGPADARARVEVTVYVRADPDATRPIDVAAEAVKPPRDRRYLNPSEAAAAYGATDGDIAAVRTFAAEHQLDVIRVNQAARSIKLGGSAAAVGAAFGVELREYARGDQQFRGHDGQVSLPRELAGIVSAVFGLDNRRLGRRMLRFPDSGLQDEIRRYVEHQHGRRHQDDHDHHHEPGDHHGHGHHHEHGDHPDHDDAGGPAVPGQPASSAQPANTFLPPQVASLYSFPSESAGDQTVAVFAFNGSIGSGASAPGGYDPSVLDEYFSSDLGLAAPQITDVTVQGPGNDPGDGSDPNDSSPEVYLDLSIVGSLAGGAKIVVYFTEFSEQGWVDAITTTATDTTNDPRVISISYGNPEDAADSAWTSAAIAQVNTAFEQAASQGRTITCAAGDSGASDGESSGLHVDFPASSPWVLACGGTRLEASGNTITSETVWNDQSDGNGATGGGVSTVFTPAPAWQTSAGVQAISGRALSGRGVPDVASLADPETPFIVAQPGGTGGVGGTSAAAPLWASLVTLCNAALRTPVGYLNPTLYALPAGTLRDIVSGNNAAPGGQGYDAGPGWDACTGFGAPGGRALLTALTSSGTATPSS